MNAICRLGIVPVRIDPDDRSEMVSQLLYGETCSIIGESNGFYNVISTYDSYTGWIDCKQIKEAKGSTAAQYIVRSAIIGNFGSYFVMGSVLIADEVIEFGLQDVIGDDILMAPISVTRDNIVDTALNLIGAPYLWGGRSRFGIDCSGFTQVVCKACGIYLPRDSSQQAAIGKEIDLQGSEPGDLAFFSKPEKENVSHVGFVTADGIIHASGWVKENELTPDGIIDSDGTLTHRLISVRRIVQ